MALNTPNIGSRFKVVIMVIPYMFGKITRFIRLIATILVIRPRITGTIWLKIRVDLNPT